MELLSVKEFYQCYQKMEGESVVVSSWTCLLE